VCDKSSRMERQPRGSVTEAMRRAAGTERCYSRCVGILRPRAEPQHSQRKESLRCKRMWRRERDSNPRWF
jgi:hypothetical protein